MKSYRSYELKTNLRAFRHDADLTQSDVALLLGTTQNTISSIERGEYSPSAYLAALICDLFKVPFEMMFYFEYDGVRSSFEDLLEMTPAKVAEHYKYLREKAVTLFVNSFDPDFENLPFV